MAIDYYERIPNNVGLADNRALQRALEQWQPRFLDWWREMGPTAFRGADIYLRTATTADESGWASYGHVALPEYRWGIFLADPVPDRRIGFGDAMGEPVWQQVPGEHRSSLRRLIVTQGDTEPASVEQQRRLGNTCPSLYDLRNLFQVNVEEGRHLWAMVYLLHAYFGRDGREEAEELLARHSGDVDKPRILGTFNEPISDWLSFFMFTYFTDRDGRFQLKSLAESAFDPLSRTCRFMLAEEAFHMFVGASGITRIIRRTLQVMKELATDDPIAEAPAAIWYVRPPTGGQYGPARGDIMRKWISEGRVSSDSLVWREGWTDWQNAGKLFPVLQAAGTAGGSLPSAPAVSTTVPITARSSLRTATRYQEKKRESNSLAIGILVSLGLVCLVLVGVLVYLLTHLK